MERAKKGMQSSATAFAEVDKGIEEARHIKWKAAEAEVLAGRDDPKTNDGMKVYQTAVSKGTLRRQHIVHKADH